MAVRFHPRFKKQYRKLAPQLQAQFNLRLRRLLDDPTDPRLHVHPLKGHFAGYWSMNVTGDIRAIYQRQGDELILFILIGTHSELYG